MNFEEFLQTKINQTKYEIEILQGYLEALEENLERVKNNFEPSYKKLDEVFQKSLKEDK